MSEMRPGYKRTEVGVIPEEWDTTTLGACGRFTSGTGFPLAYQGEPTGRYPFLKVSDFSHPHNSQRMEASNHWISEDVRKQLGAKVHAAEALVFAKIGAAIFLERKRLLARDSCIDNNMMSFDVDRRVGWPSFFQYRLQTMAFGSIVAASALPTLSAKDLKAIQIPLPPFAEQKAVAEALGDADALIAALETLIAKKRDIKQGATQELLTGQRRLPGFQGEWVKMPIEALVGALDAGVSVRSVPGDGSSAGHDDYVLKTSCIAGGSFFPIEAKIILPEDRARARTPVRGDTIIISRMNTPDLVGEVGYVPVDFNNLFLPDRLWMARRAPGHDVDMRWLAAMLAHSATGRALKDTATGTSGSMKNISKTALLALVVPCPKTEEQHAIAAVLSDMDADIDALEDKLAKARAVKQGMMQVLLTGEVRVV